MREDSHKIFNHSVKEKTRRKNHDFPGTCKIVLVVFHFFPRASERRVLPIVGVCQTFSHRHIFSSSHPHIFTSSHLHILTSSHLLIFKSSHPQILTSSHPHIFAPSHLHIFSSSHLHITSSHPLIFTSSHLHIFTSSHLHILTSSHLHILSCPLCSLALLHEPNTVPTWPKMSQHSPKLPKISPIWSQLLPNKGQHKPQNTPKLLNMSPKWCRHSPQWPNISPRSGKHSLSAACHKRKKQKQPKDSSKNQQQRTPKIVFFLGIYCVFPQNTTKMAQHEPPMLAQYLRSAQHGQKWGRRSQNCTQIFCKSNIGFAHAACPPPHTPPRAKQSYINPLRCSSA